MKNSSTVLITGASGMVGSNLSECSALTDNFNILCPSSRNELNLLDEKSVLLYLQKHQPEFIIHCAGRVGGIQANIKNPVSFLTENWDMGKNLILAAKQVGVKKILNLASSCIYPHSAKSPLTESLILQGPLEPTNEGYALAKISVLKLCQYIHQENSEFQYKTIIPCNLYGRWDKFDPLHSHMVPAVIAKIHQAKIKNQNEIEIWGDGEARREFMYAADLADFIAHALKHFSELPQLMNVGLGYDYSINDYYKTIAEIINYKGSFTWDLSKPVGMKQKMVSIEEQNKLNWKPKHSLKEGFEKTYQFYLGNILC